MNAWVTALSYPPNGLELALMYLVLIGAGLIASLPAYGRVLMARIHGIRRDRYEAPHPALNDGAAAGEAMAAGLAREAIGSVPPKPAPYCAERQGCAGSELRCRMDLAATNDGLELILELPGIEQKDLEIRVIDGAMTINGAIRQPSDWKEHAFRVVEREFGTFSRSLELPEGVRADRIKAFLNLGLLKVTIPNPTKPEPKIIVIEAGDMRLNPTPSGLELTVDLPGLEEQDIDVSVSGDRLHIRGARRSPDAARDGRAFVECGHESFSRAIELPGGANVEQISAVMRRGELKVMIPVPTKAETKIIDVGTTA